MEGWRKLFNLRWLSLLHILLCINFFTMESTYISEEQLSSSPSIYVWLWTIIYLYCTSYWIAHLQYQSVWWDHCVYSVICPPHQHVHTSLLYAMHSSHPVRTHNTLPSCNYNNINYLHTTISLLCMHVHYTPIGSLVGNWLLSVQFSSYIQSETFNTLRIHAASSLTKHLCNYICMHTSHAIDTKPYSMLNAKLLYCNFKLD